MRFTTLTIFIFVILNSCKLSTGKKELSSMDSVYLEMSTYINEPELTDTLCQKDINKAKLDISNGKIVMNDLIGFDKGNRRYANQLKKLAETQGLIFQPEGEHCVVYAGQTQGCYSLYMDKVIAERFGDGFEQILHERADSLYFEQVKNDAIWFWNCDEEPQLLPDNSAIERDIGGGLIFRGVILETDIKVPENKLETIFDEDRYPTFVNVDITINKKGLVIDLQHDELAKSKEDSLLNKRLFPYAVEEIKAKYSNWKPGTIRGQPMNTKYDLRVYFKNKAT